MTNIADISADTSKEAKACRIFYPIAKTAVLRSFAWPFAKKTVDLAAVSTGLYGKWYTHFQYPSNALWIVDVYPTPTVAIQSDWATGAWRNPLINSWEVIGGTTSALIGSNLTAATADYIEDIADENAFRFTPDFVEALTFKLAYELASVLLKSDSMVDRMGNGYIEFINGAKARAHNESFIRKDPSIITDRYW